MIRRSYALLPLLLAAVVVVGCKSTKDECIANYTLIDKSKDACKAAFPTLTEIVAPVPGPIIIIRKDSASGTLQWSVDSGSSPVIQTAGASAFTSGTIRSDFVGTKILDWSVTSDATTVYSPANYVVFTTKNGGDTYYIEMARTAGDKVKWYITKNGNRKLLVADGSLPTDQVPVEFTYPLATTGEIFREQLEDVSLDKVDYFRVGM